MTALPEEAVKAAQSELSRIISEWERNREFLNVSPEAMKNFMGRQATTLTAALPFLPVQGAVKKLEWTKGVVDIAQPHPGMKYVACSTTPKGSWAWWLDNAPETRGVFTSEASAKAAAQADYEARILSAIELLGNSEQLEPSAARELALEPWKNFASEMSDTALELGIAGTSDWDKIAGGVDIFGLQDAIRSLISTGGDDE